MAFDLFGDKKPKRQRITEGDKSNILKNQNEKCANCGKKFSASSVIHYDHIKALGAGGKDSIGNIQALCPNCHAEKTRQDRTKIAKKNSKKKEKDPFSGLLDVPKPRKGKSKDPFGLDIPDVKVPTFGLDTPKKKSRKKKDPFSIF